jgi:hypothetical protein
MMPNLQIGKLYCGIPIMPTRLQPARNGRKKTAPGLRCLSGCWRSRLPGGSA